MRLPIYQLDAFAAKLFGGNPAAVMPLDAWLPDAKLQALAAENNLSETAFLVPKGEGYHLRWFTPAAEIDLCGHATLASGWVVLNRLDPARAAVDFDTLSGRLSVRRDAEGRLVMDFPAWPPEPVAAPDGLLAALGGPSTAPVLRHRDWMVVYDDAKTVRDLAPDFAALGRFDRSIIVTAPGEGDIDFVSRFFAMPVGIPEDPVTGSAHVQLAPYWAARLGKSRLKAFQASPRGGLLHCELAGDRVKIAGDCVLYMEGAAFV